MVNKIKSLSFGLGIFGIVYGFTLLLISMKFNIFLYSVLGMFFLISGCLSFCWSLVLAHQDELEGLNETTGGSQ